MNFDNFKDAYQKAPVEHYPNEVPKNPLVSVCVQTYQHVDYIRDCLDGILMQETDFNYEILLGEDASTDGTREVCIKYAEKYPDKIRLFLHDRKNNIEINGQPSGRFNSLYNTYSAKGKYIAKCEGDDYWTDPLKLQKQVEFMEGNGDCSLCYHPAKIIYEDNSRPDAINKAKRVTPPKNFNLREFIKSDNDLGITTASMVFRSDVISNIPDWFPKAPYGDASLKLMCGYMGLLCCISEEPMSIHRRVVPGSWSSNIHSKNWYIKRIQNRYLQYDLFNEYSGFKFDKEIYKANKRKIASILLQMKSYCSRKEFISLLIKNIDALPYFKLRALVLTVSHLILGERVYSKIKVLVR